MGGGRGIFLRASRRIEPSFFLLWQGKFIVELFEDDFLELGESFVFDNKNALGVEIDERNTITVNELNDVLIK